MVGGKVLEDKITLMDPLPEEYKYDLPVPAEVMDPKNSRPGSKWSMEITFILQKNDEGEYTYVQRELLEAYINKPSEEESL